MIEPLHVHYKRTPAGFLQLSLLLLIGCIWIFSSSAKLNLVLGALAVATIFKILFDFIRPPPPLTMFVIDEDGVTLSCAGGLLLPHSVIDRWEIRYYRGETDASRVFSIWCSPRQRLSVGYWARLNGIRSNTLFDGDVVFDSGCFDRKITEVNDILEHYHRLYQTRSGAESRGDSSSA